MENNMKTNEKKHTKSVPRYQKNKTNQTIKNNNDDFETKLQNALNLGSKVKTNTKNISQTKQEKQTKKTQNIVEKNNSVERKSMVSKKTAPKKEIKKDFEFKKSNLKVIALGGLEEIGKNMTVFEYEDEIVVVDCGLEFPTDDMLGVDLVIPDTTYLEKNVEKIKGIVITHGHEDHIGSIPYLLQKINVPVYASKLAIGLIENKLEEHKLLGGAQLKTIYPGQTINLGKMKVEFIHSCHSIPDAMMIALHTPAGTVLHTGDFKIDYTPINSEMTDLNRIAELGNKGVLLLLSDSTNAEKSGFTMSERTVGAELDKLFVNCEKRIVVATFASNVHRIQQIADLAVKYGRKIAVCGRSMANTIETARKLGYMDVPDNLFIDIEMIKNYKENQLVIITTGSQGETMSALTRMAAGEHKKVEITSNDLVIISATPIPGNEKSVAEVIDDLMQIGAEVVYNDTHVSGHACQEEQKLILALSKPKYFMPVHGEYRQLKAHKETAMSMGIPSDNIFMSVNGRILELNEHEAKLTGTVPSGQILVDGLGVGDVGSVVLRDRQHLSQDGLIVIVMTMDSATGEIVAGPDVITRGFVYVKESENLMEDVKNEIRVIVSSIERQGIRDWGTIKSILKDHIRDYIFEKTKRNPMLLPVIMNL